MKENVFENGCVQAPKGWSSKSHGAHFILAWITFNPSMDNLSHFKCGIKLLIHDQT